MQLGVVDELVPVRLHLRPDLPNRQLLIEMLLLGKHLLHWQLHVDLVQLVVVLLR